MITFTSMITHDFHESKIIIDLIFVSLTIHDWLIHCQVVFELNKVSDYKSIETFFYFNVRMREMIKHRSWKRTDTETVKKISNMLWISRYLNFSIKIKQYAVYLMQFTENLMKKTVSWIKNEEKTVFWWLLSIVEAVKKYKNAL